MKFKLIVAFVNDHVTQQVLDASREAGATGATIINKAHGEGVVKNKTFFGITLENQFDVILFLVEEHLSRDILEKISAIGKFESSSGYGIAFQVDSEDAVGVSHQIIELLELVEEKI